MLPESSCRRNLLESSHWEIGLTDGRWNSLVVGGADRGCGNDALLGMGKRGVDRGNTVVYS
jgi:hypothetical protein